jgi:hypothetical protein
MAKLCCYRCGLEYGSEFWADVVIPNWAWRAISPTGEYFVSTA